MEVDKGKGMMDHQLEEEGDWEGLYD